MLVLTRKLGESIRIGDNIIVKVVDLDSRHVKLGIDAPRSVSVNREEIYERIQNENKAASTMKDQGVKNIADALRKSKNPE
jgi:carbon storage regulator